MTLIVISVDRDELPSHTDEQFEEWIEYNVGARVGINIVSPLHDVSMISTVKEWG